MRDAVIVTGVRTPVGRYLGSLKEIPAYDLGAIVLKEVVKRAALDPSRIDEVIMGQSYQSGESVNVARMALLKAGFPDSIPGITVDRRCCTGLDVVCLAAMKIQAGYADIVVAGGVESMSNAEFLSSRINQVGRWRGPWYASRPRRSLNLGSSSL